MIGMGYEGSKLRVVAQVRGVAPRFWALQHVGTFSTSATSTRLSGPEVGLKPREDCPLHRAIYMVVCSLGREGVTIVLVVSLTKSVLL